jgi:transglutaminase-like putative cysteine protease
MRSQRGIDGGFTVLRDNRWMRVRVGCEFHYDALGPTAAIWQVRPRPDGGHRVLTESWGTSPPTPTSFYLDSYGNLCDRMTLPQGATVVRYDADVEVPAHFDESDKDASQLPVDRLPDEAMVFLLPSRFCLSDILGDQAWDLFGATEPGWARVQAVCDWVHGHVRFQPGSSTAITTAVDVCQSGTGVCRDFAHLGVTFCRSLNIPARYVFGYLPDIGVPTSEDPMDFCAWFEAYLEDRWWTFDPRNNIPRAGRVVIGRGRDALDVAMVTTYGAPILQNMNVWADEIPG